MRLFIRNKQNWINFLHSTEEFKQFVDNYIPGTQLVIGDISLFNSSMKTMLLKFLEENELVDCYSSQDIMDPVLLSRFIEIIKEPLSYQSVSFEELRELEKSYSNIIGTELSNVSKLYAYRASSSILNILSLL